PVDLGAIVENVGADLPRIGPERRHAHVVHALALACPEAVLVRSMRLPASEPEEKRRRLRTLVEEVLKVRRVVAFRYAARHDAGKIAAVVLFADGRAVQS